MWIITLLCELVILALVGLFAYFCRRGIVLLLCLSVAYLLGIQLGKRVMEWMVLYLLWMSADFPAAFMCGGLILATATLVLRALPAELRKWLFLAIAAELVAHLIVDMSVWLLVVLPHDNSDVANICNSAAISAVLCENIECISNAMHSSQAMDILSSIGRVLWNHYVLDIFRWSPTIWHPLLDEVFGSCLDALDVIGYAWSAISTLCTEVLCTAASIIYKYLGGSLLLEAASIIWDAVRQASPGSALIKLIYAALLYVLKALSSLIIAHILVYACIVWYWYRRTM